MLMGQPTVGPRRKLFGDPMADLPPDMLRMLPFPNVEQGMGPESLREAQRSLQRSMAPAEGVTPSPTAAQHLAATERAQRPDPLSMDTIAEGQPSAMPRLPAGVSQFNRAAAALNPGQRSPLGASLQQPIDYEKMRADMMDMGGKEPSKWQKAAMVIAPMLMALGGNQAGANAAIQNFMEQRRDFERRRMRVNEQIADWRYKDYARQNEADLGASAPFTIGRSRLQYNPDTGQTQSLYEGDDDAELYAKSLGLEPGSDKYFSAVEDYVLRSSGPSAHDRDLALDNYRTANDIELEGVRNTNRSSLEEQRQRNRIASKGTPTYRDTHPSPRTGRGGGSSQPSATGPNGEKIYWNGKGWTDAQGRPVG